MPGCSIGPADTPDPHDRMFRERFNSAAMQGRYRTDHRWRLREASAPRGESVVLPGLPETAPSALESAPMSMSVVSRGVTALGERGSVSGSRDHEAVE